MTGAKRPARNLHFACSLASKRNAIFALSLARPRCSKSASAAAISPRVSFASRRSPNTRFAVQKKKPKKKKEKREEKPMLSLAEQMLEMDAQLERLQARSAPAPSLAEQMADMERRTADLPKLAEPTPLPPPPPPSSEEVLRLIYEKLLEYPTPPKMKAGDIAVGVRN